MSFLDQLLLPFRARNEASKGVDGRARRLVETFGKSPVELERDSLKHRESVQAIAAQGELRDRQAELDQLQAAQTTVGTPTLLTLALLLLSVCEIWGALRLLQSLNIPAEQRFFPAVALAMTLMVVTKATADVTAKKSLITSTAKGDEPLPFSWQSAVIPVVYGALIVAIAAVRIASQGEDEEGTDTLGWADAALTVAVTAGPAWLAAIVAKKRVVAVEFAKRIALVQRRVNDLKRRESQARDYLRGLDTRAAAHTQAVTRADATYSLAHDVARADQILPPSDETPRS